jgi:DNA-binding IclR family transcriptional regulator
MSDEIHSSVKSADRVLDLFELLARRNEGLSHKEIAEKLDIPKSSLTQLLKNVVGRGYISFSAKEKCYRLGERFKAMARQTSGRQDFVTLAQPILEDITSQTRESSALNILRGDMAEVVATVNSSQRLVSHMRLGDLAPLYAISGGKILLAELSTEALNDYLSHVSFEAIASNTISSADELRRELDKVRRNGIAYSIEEFTPGIVGLAKSVIGADGELLGSINVALPAVRYNPKSEDVISTVLSQAKLDLERQLKV